MTVKVRCRHLKLINVVFGISGVLRILQMVNREMSLPNGWGEDVFSKGVKSFGYHFYRSLFIPCFQLEKPFKVVLSLYINLLLINLLRY